MIKMKIYDRNKTYMFPNGAIATPGEVEKQFPAINLFKHIIETDESEEILWSVQNLSAMRDLEGYDNTLSDDEVISLMQEKRNAPLPEPEPSAEERIAAALEYQNLLTL